MKTKEEIKEKLETYKKTKCFFSTEFSLILGAVTALEWVLEEEQQND